MELGFGPGQAVPEFVCLVTQLHYSFDTTWGRSESCKPRLTTQGQLNGQMHVFGLCA